MDKESATQRVTAKVKPSTKAAMERVVKREETYIDDKGKERRHTESSIIRLAVENYPHIQKAMKSLKRNGASVSRPVS